MRLWHDVWPITLMLAIMALTIIAVALWVLGEMIIRVYQTRVDGLRMRDLICLNQTKEEIERGMRRLRERQKYMQHELHSLNLQLHGQGPKTDDDKRPR